MRWLTNFYDFSFKWIATAAIGIHPDCHSWWISKMQSGREKKTICNKILFWTWKKCHRNVWNASHCSLDHLTWIEHWFLSGIRDSRKAGSLGGMMRGVGGVKKSIHQSWLAKGLGLLCWGFKGVQEEIPRQEASTLQIGSVAFPPGQCTSPQLHPYHETIWPRWASRQFLTLPYSPDLTLFDFWLFP